MNTPQKQTDVDAIRAQVRGRFASVAANPASETRFEIGGASALKLGYDARLLGSVPAPAVESFAGVGNPLGLAPLRAGMTVLDLGCGSGVDAVLAARLVGPAGKVLGIDMTDEMVIKARTACAEAGLSNVQIRNGTAESLNIADASIDVAISNGAINLCPDKERVLAELYRVLRPGGRLQVADMVLVEGVNPALLERVGQWSD